MAISRYCPFQKEPFHDQSSRNNISRRLDAVLGGIAHAADAEFLKSLDGNWGGKGSVKVEANSTPISVNCKFSSDTTESSMALDGNCTGLVVVSRAIGATIRTNGKSARDLYRLEHWSCRPQRQALGQCAQSRHPLGKGRQRRPLCQAAAREGWRQWHAADHGRYRPRHWQERDHQRDQPAPLVSQAAREGA